MTFELDYLIAITFIAPIAFFVVLNIAVFRARGYEPVAKPAAAFSARVVETAPAMVAVEAANDSEFREAA